MATSREQNIAALRRTSAELRRLTDGLDDAALDFRTAPEEWSVREILAHLVDDEMYVMRLRLERIIKEDQPHLAPHDEKRWHATRNTSRDELPDLLDDFDLQRAASLGIFAMLRESDWQRMGFQPEYGEFTAEGWLETWAAHDRLHLDQIAAILDQYRRQHVS